MQEMWVGIEATPLSNPDGELNIDDRRLGHTHVFGKTTLMSGVANLMSAFTQRATYIFDAPLGLGHAALRLCQNVLQGQCEVPCDLPPRISLDEK